MHILSKNAAFVVGSLQNVCFTFFPFLDKLMKFYKIYMISTHKPWK